jgi:cysteine desulfurase
LFSLTNRLIAFLDTLDGVQFRGSRSARLPNTVACTVSGADSIALLAGLDLEGVCASSGSACSAGSLEPSHVMLAMGVKKDLANSLVRFSLGRNSTLEELLLAESAFENVINRARRR